MNEPGDLISTDPVHPQPPVGFPSIAFPFGIAPELSESSDCFRDLRLDQVLAAIVAGREEYDLLPLFRAPLSTPHEVTWRQEVMRDLEHRVVRESIDALAVAMKTVRLRLKLATSGYFDLERRRWFLAGAESYVAGVEEIARTLASAAPASRGLKTFVRSLEAYVGGPQFEALARDTRTVVSALDQVRYAIVIHEGTVAVGRQAASSDYSDVVEELFEKFRQGTVHDYRHAFRDQGGMNQVEAQIAVRVARLHPEPFRQLEKFCQKHASFLEPGIARFDREAQFYAAYLDHVAELRAAGLPFAYPLISDSKETVVRDTFDLALADRLVREGTRVVLNSFRLEDPERVLVVSGPNQGGKTTFARTFGQLHYLARLGCAIPGREAVVFHCDRIFTHFGRSEDIGTLRGQLESDLVRAHGILTDATERSVLILNEIFSSTTLEDSVFLGRKLLGRIIQLGARCVWVTFLDELASLGPETVSMVACVDPIDRTLRTFKIERRPAEGLAYALAIAEKHLVTHDRLRERISR